VKTKGFVDQNLCPRIPFLSIEGEKLSLVVDTGFNGALCLPRPLLKELNFEMIGTYEVELADGSCVPSAVYLGELLWFKKKTSVIAHETLSSEGLVGTELLRGCRFELEIDKNFVLIIKK